MIGIVKNLTPENLDVRIKLINGNYGIANFVNNKLISVLTIDTDEIDKNESKAGDDLELPY